ncbi:hypothetical protein L1987_86305 [Smallanthus sonchifolius]|uniref:Uncharacterized protein n=1 Tax=Smallanthus sonchifolius TaxID=185202 RepID=A0ACB8XYY6_9ASTR|nr:hypothetical protein L1987_86305 [Smallanthus sonchifolius]
MSKETCKALLKSVFSSYNHVSLFICPRLTYHERNIKKEAEKADKEYHKLLGEPCEIKDLKELKKTVTKLKIQIPARYRTSDKSDKQKKLDTGIEDTKIEPKLQKKMPLLQHKLFHQSSFCRTIQLQFNKLSCQLKLCLLCFTVFPENAIISRRSMVYWWIGEGLTPHEDDLDGENTAEDYANEFFKKLMDNDFIEPVVPKSDHRYVAFCKMHPMVRAALVMIADKIKFFDFDEYGNPKDFGKFDEIVSPEDLPERYPLGDQKEFFEFYDKNRKKISEPIEISDEKGNRYQFAPLDQDQLNDVKDDDTNKKTIVDREGMPIDTTKKYYFYRKKPFTTMSFKVCLMGSGLSKGLTWEKLHMLFNVKDDMLEFKPEWFSRMNNINVVFLGRWQKWLAHHIEFDDFEFEKSLDHMNNVRFFSLQGVSRVSKLPASISKLKSLLILDLRACHNLEEIPETIDKFVALRKLTILWGGQGSKEPETNNSKEPETTNSIQGVVTNPIISSKKPNLASIVKRIISGKKPQVRGMRRMNAFGNSKEPETNNSKEPETNNSIHEVLTKKKHVGGMRRMNAFGNSPLGSRLEKLDLKCFPHTYTPNWLTAGNLQGLKKLYIRGGRFSDLGQYKDTVEWDDSAIPPKETWNVEILRLKYLEELNMEWRELHDLFPKLTSLEKVKCPKVTLFPCDEHGVWNKKGTKTT